MRISSSGIALRRNAFGFSAPLRKFLAATLASVAWEMLWSCMYLLAFMPKNLVVTNCPFSRIPLRQRQLGGVVGERAARVLVQADGDADVVLAQPDGVGGLLNGTGRGGAGVEHVGERDAGQPDQAGHRVGVGHLVAAAEAELDVLPLHTGVGQRGLDGLGAHLHRGLVEPAERMQAHADDGDIVSHLRLLL